MEGEAFLALFQGMEVRGSDDLCNTCQALRVGAHVDQDRHSSAGVARVDIGVEDNHGVDYRIESLGSDGQVRPNVHFHIVSRSISTRVFADVVLVEVVYRYKKVQTFVHRSPVLDFRTVSQSKSILVFAEVGFSQRVEVQVDFPAQIAEDWFSQCFVVQDDRPA